MVFNKEGKDPHYRITLRAAGETFEVDIPIQSQDGSQALYTVDHSFVPPDAAALHQMGPGVCGCPASPADSPWISSAKRLAAAPWQMNARWPFFPGTFRRPLSQRFEPWWTC